MPWFLRQLSPLTPLGGPPVPLVLQPLSATEATTSLCRSHKGLLLPFRADRNGAVYIIGRSGVLAGLPGELGTAPLTASQVETLGVAELQKELAARGAVMDTGAEHYTQKGLRAALKRNIRNPEPDIRVGRMWGIARTYTYDPRAPYYPQAYQSRAEQRGDPGFSSDDERNYYGP